MISLTLRRWSDIDFIDVLYIDVFFLEELLDHSWIDLSVQYRRGPCSNSSVVFYRPFNLHLQH